ncbi:MAG: pantetheine-phosphate adenylyltransferase [Thermomicrobiales bacterium]|jgi:pantetheine-phosphate adenylyltransferase|nr:pantetheine-phosphate adenylyltransferase [Thermomicrobiales bacterium]
MTNAVYPGSFDPITLGHVDLATRAARLFEHVTVGIYTRSQKPGALFDPERRLSMAQDALAHIPNITVDSFSGLTVDFAREHGASVIVRGLRAVSDFEYEFKLTHMNHHLAPDIEVVCLMTSSKHSFVSSSFIREVASLGGDVSALVPGNVNLALQERFGLLAPVGD